jgi:hypothetical protein
MDWQFWLILSALLTGLLVGEAIHLVIGIIQWKRALRRQRWIEQDVLHSKCGA